MRSARCTWTDAGGLGSPGVGVAPRVGVAYILTGSAEEPGPAWKGRSLTGFPGRAAEEEDVTDGGRNSSRHRLVGGA